MIAKRRRTEASSEVKRLRRRNHASGKREQREGDGRITHRRAMDGRMVETRVWVDCRRLAAAAAKATGVAPEPVAIVAGVRVPVTLAGRPESVRVMGPGKVLVMMGVTTRL